MSNEIITVVDISNPITVSDANDEYTFIITSDEYVFTITDTEFYKPALKFNNRRNSMYLEVLPAF